MMNIPKPFEIPEMPVCRGTITEWYCCRKCGQKLFKIYPGAKARGILMKCKRCKEIIEITI